MRHIASFDTDDPKRLSQQLSDLEDNMVSGFDAVHAAMLKPYTTEAPLTSTTVQVAVGSLVTVDANGATLVFPESTAGNRGGRIAVVRTSASGTVTVAPVAGTVMGGATHTVTAAIGLYEFVSANGWWRKA